MATTVRKIITGAMRLIGLVQANEVPSDAEIQVGLKALDVMIDSWSNDSLMIYTINPYYFEAISNKQDYTLGPGGDWDIIRPMNIEQAYVDWETDTGGGGQEIVSLPISIANDSQWSSIVVKYISTQFPTILYDNGNYPLRKISLYPIPNQTITIVLWLWQPLLTFQSLDAEVSFPKGYERAVRFNLAVELAPEYGRIPPETVKSTAIDTKTTLAAINATTQFMRMDPSMGQRSPTYNWLYSTTLPIPR